MMADRGGRRILTGMPLALLALAASGCGTLVASFDQRVRDNPTPYFGVRFAVERLTASDRDSGAGEGPFSIPGRIVWLLDIPISFAVDTAFLPIMIIAKPNCACRSGTRRRSFPAPEESNVQDKTGGWKG